MFSPADYYNKSSRDSLHEAIRHRAGLAHLSDDEVAEIYESDNLIAKIFDNLAYWVASFEWDLSSTDAEVASLVKDFLEESDLLFYLAAAYKYACLFEEAYIVLHPGWFENVDNLRVIGIEHRHSRISFDDQFYTFNSNKEVRYPIKQLLEVRSQDSFRKIFPAYHQYLSALEQAEALSGSSSLLTISDEFLVKDQAKYRDRNKFIEYLTQISTNALQQLRQNGVAAFAGKPQIQNHQRSAKDALDFVEKAKDRFLASADLPEFVLFGKSSNGSGLSGIHEFTDRQINKIVKSRRATSFSKIVNFFISRFLLSIGENPKTVRVNWSVTAPSSAREKAEIELLKAQTQKLQLASGILTVEEVRAQYLGRSSSQDIVVENIQNKDSLSLIDSVQLKFVEQLWDDYKAYTNLGFDELVKLKNSSNSLAPNDRIHLNRNIILSTVTKQEVSRSSELQRWALRTVKKLKKLGALPASPEVLISQKCWGYDPNLPSIVKR